MATDDTLSPSESTDSDEVRNDDGDIVVDPPDDWSEADRFGMTAREEEEGESLEARLAEEGPDVVPEDGPPRNGRRVCTAARSTELPRTGTHCSTLTGDVSVVSRSVARNCIAP